METNSEVSTEKKTELEKGFYKIWNLRVNDPLSNRALWLRFSLLSSGNGFKRAAETWAVFFQKTQPGEIRKVALKQTYDLDRFSSNDTTGIRIGDCELSEVHTRGIIQSKGNSIQWNLQLLPGRKNTFSLVPDILSRSKLAKNSIVTDCEELLFTGTVQINQETFEWDEAPGMQGHRQGPRGAKSWVWGHCNTFKDDQGGPTTFAFEGLSARSQLGPFTGPQLSSFYFHYQDQDYYFNTLKDAFFIKSHHTLKEWTFQVDRDDLSFRGYAKAEHKDFAGLTFEDTDGSLLYCSNSNLSDMQVFVYRGGKLEATFHALGTAAFEVVSRNKNPYVPILI